MNKILLFLFAISIGTMALSQERESALTLDLCYKWAEQNYPLIKNRNIIEQSKAFSLQNVSKGYYPQIGVYAQASYQSDVTSIAIDVPGINIPSINKDQYTVYAEISQVVYDGGVIKLQKKAEEAKSKIEQQKLEVDLYALKERVNDVYFGILLINEQLGINALLIDDIDLGIRTIEARIKNGDAFRSNADQMKAEKLTVKQQNITLETAKKSYIDILGLLINRNLSGDVNLQIPETPVPGEGINRPELALYQYQNESLDTQKETIDANNRPKLGLFGQTGYANPALNMFDPKFQFYYLVGAKISIPISGRYTQKNQKNMLELNKQSINNQRETFLYNIKQNLKQQNAEIDKLEQYLVTDDEIIALRSSVKNATIAQLKNGVITTNDYLKEVNEENTARKNKSAHQIELLLAKYKEKTTKGN